MIIPTVVALLVSCLITCPVYAQHADDKPLVLQAGIIKLIDNTSIGINGYKIKLMLQVLLKLQNILEGEVDAQGMHQGLYLYNGKKYSVQELVQLEAQLESDPQKKGSLRKLLDVVKEDFDQKIAHFITDARGAKPLLHMLMLESCKRHHRADSFLLSWGKAEEGHEKDALQNEIITFSAFELFCLDLKRFIQDMINSCPKAVEDYKKLRAQYTAEHKHSDIH